MRSITVGLPKADFGSYDVTLIVWMLNDIAESQITSLAETSTLGNDILDLCDHLHMFRRPILVVGGSADLWGFELRWDGMVQQISRMTRTQGIPTIDGVQYVPSFNAGISAVRAIYVGKYGSLSGRYTI